MRGRVLFLWRIMKNPFYVLNKKDWMLYLTSLTIVIISNLIGQFNILNLISTTLGVTCLIFMAKGNVWGHVFSIIFCFLYAVQSYLEKYYGEIIISMVMTLPLAVFSIYTWLKNPFKKGENVVKIKILSLKEKVLLFILAIAVSLVFYFILKALGTESLTVSTISVFTSFLASYLLLRRNSFYAVAYMLNDIVLITLWTIATIKQLSNISILACFLTFFFNDLYAFVKWKIREREQGVKK